MGNFQKQVSVIVWEGVLVPWLCAKASNEVQGWITCIQCTLEAKLRSNLSLCNLSKQTTGMQHNHI